jgi:hypothetical protein
MSEHVIETINHKGLTIKLLPDTDAQSPRGDCNLGKMVCWHKRYQLGDEQPSNSPDEWEVYMAESVAPGMDERIDRLYSRIVTAKYDTPEYKPQLRQYDEARSKAIHKALDAAYLMLPLYLFDHSGISMSTGSFGDPWDSGQVGWIYMDRKTAIENWGKAKLTKAVRAQALESLKSEVEVYDQFLTGDVYGYVVEDEDGAEVDSCWGFFGLDYCRAEAVSAADSHLAREAQNLETVAGDIPMSPTWERLLVRGDATTPGAQ